MKADRQKREVDQCQARVEHPQVRVEGIKTWSPATYLPGEKREPLCPHPKTMKKDFSATSGLSDTLVPDRNGTFFTDRSRRPHQLSSCQRQGPQASYANRKSERVPHKGLEVDFTELQVTNLGSATPMQNQQQLLAREAGHHL